jgi:putative ABC transport system permease protein
VGGILGIGVGVVTSLIISRVAQWSTVLSTGSIVLAFAFSGLVGVFFGYYPARKAAFLDPIEALRYE